MEGTMGSICPQAEININKKINGKTQKLANACDIVTEGLTKKYVKGDVSIRDSFKQKRESKWIGVT
jgi:hypothetical protein